LGTGPTAAARQAAVLFFLAGVLALVGVAGKLGGTRQLCTVAGLDFAAALVALLFPWHRTRPDAPAALGVAGMAILGLSTWSFGGVAAGTGPFLVLLYAWAALHFRRRILLAFAPPATLAYVLPLILTGQPTLVLSSAFVLLPVALAIALLVEAQARHLRDDRERLARIEQWRSAMISTLAHDVRSPLTTVQFALEELNDHVSGDAAELIDTALRQTGRIGRLAEGLLDIHRIDSAGHLKLDRQTLSAQRLVRDALAHVRAADVTIDIDDESTIHVDPQRFEQIIVNLVGNALRYGHPPVVVRLTRQGPVDRLEVRDHGPGIPPALRPKLFTQFAVGGRDGVGLGLWIVRKLVEVHGGAIVAEPRTPGVAMVVTLPAPDA
jgi:signal transduction histidine kinase